MAKNCLPKTLIAPFNAWERDNLKKDLIFLLKIKLEQEK